ncbi:MAG: phenylacetate-CoA oxygenase/reductase subunit PaaK [Bacteroidota bacterium]|jgi:ring-1,2-phenylacetyl-CoA epoxidase subunit PaaE
MSLHFYKTKVKSIEKLTPECVGITLDMTGLNADLFQFKAGQYITLKKEIEGVEVRRSYSIYSSPTSNELCVGIKWVEGGVFSTYANKFLKEGDELFIMPPQGNFTLPQNLDSVKTIVFYCAGSGITPVMSIAQFVLENYDNIHVILYYGNRNTDLIIFKEKIEALKNLYVTRISVHYILSKDAPSSPLFYGRIDGEKCKTFEKYFTIDQVNSLYYLCGPSKMIFEVKDTLTSLGVDQRKIHFELFNTSGLNFEKKKSVQEQNLKSKIIMILDGIKFDFSYNEADGNILDSALNNGADLPYACKGGVCSTCKAHCSEGKVDMLLNYSLEPEEIDAGYVLTCQSVPLTETVVINFDK